jgi:hypothetical protein
MREEFTQRTKEILAKRVAWRCSFRGCGIVTIGPGHESNESIINLGEAAHINAASPLGPRFDEKMTSIERTSIDNGIWMCRHHARLIDSDCINYSSETIRQWKLLAEEEAYRTLKEVGKDNFKIPTTLVSIGEEVIFEGVWKAVKDGAWIFEVHHFLVGTEKDLKAFDANSKSQELNYIVVESEGDGRLLKGGIDWALVDGKVEIALKVEDKLPRTTPYHLGDISAEFEIENGDLKIVRGEDCAKQTIMLTLSTDFGDMWCSPTFGSYFSVYYWASLGRPNLFERLIKLEITRLLSIPRKKHSDKTGKKLLDLMDDNSSPPLDFINRVTSVKVLPPKSGDDRISIQLRLEWGDGKHWEDKIDIYIKPENEISKTTNLFKSLSKASQ